jgi:hypothetical protein
MIGGRSWRPENPEYDMVAHMDGSLKQEETSLQHEQVERRCEMKVVRNIIQIPKPPLASARLLPAVNSEATVPSAMVPAISGEVSNGHTEISADLEPGVSGTVHIRFSASIPAVNGATFKSWRGQVSDIIDAAIEERIARFSGISSDTQKPEQYASQYAAAAFSYVTKGDFTSYDNQSANPFGPPQSPQALQLARSILQLNSSTILLAGELTATIANPTVKAFIPATYFLFANDKLTAFVSYGGLVVLIGEEEVRTQPGVIVAA